MKKTLNKKTNQKLNKKPVVGGQAVIGGVMMRCGGVYSIAVRKSKKKSLLKC